LCLLQQVSSTTVKLKREKEKKMLYKEWRERTAAVAPEVLLERAYQLLQEWNEIEEEQAEDILNQFTANKDGDCWGEALPGATMNFVNWGI
jgi:hypothetical protein